MEKTQEYAQIYERLAQEAQELTLNAYQTEAYRRLNWHASTGEREQNWIYGLDEEIGEVMSLLKHHRFGGEPLSKEKVAKEIGDILWYLSALCSHMDLKLGTIAALNLAKLRFRYPEEHYTVERSQQRRALEGEFKDTLEYKALVSALSGVDLHTEEDNVYAGDYFWA